MFCIFSCIFSPWEFGRYNFCIQSKMAATIPKRSIESQSNAIQHKISIERIWISIKPIKYYLEFGRSIETSLLLTIKFQSFDCVRYLRFDWFFINPVRLRMSGVLRVWLIRENALSANERILLTGNIDACSKTGVIAWEINLFREINTCCVSLISDYQFNSVNQSSCNQINNFFLIDWIHWIQLLLFESFDWFD